MQYILTQDEYDRHVKEIKELNAKIYEVCSIAADQIHGCVFRSGRFTPNKISYCVDCQFDEYCTYPYKEYPK